MDQWKKADGCLDKKMEILKKLADNTETQSRFIRGRKMTGLNRVLREREALIGELTAVDRELASDIKWKNMKVLATKALAIAAKQQEIVGRSRQVLQEALAEQARIAAELSGNKKMRHIKHQYVNPWAVVARGRRINEKG